MWRQPKTDWQPSDYFNIEDYNRIKGNLNEIREQALILWPDFDFEDMGEDKAYSDYGFYADEINRFESNVACFLFLWAKEKLFMKISHLLTGRS